jgi:Domain of unknown function (DUF397)
MEQMNDSDPTDARWTKSSYSNGSGACVQVALIRGTAAVRDSKDPTGPLLVFTPDAWDAFIEGVRNNALIPRL